MAKQTSPTILDRLVGYISPIAGVRRMAARRALSKYEAASPSRLRKHARDKRSPDMQVKQGAVALRTLARDLEQNHDIARGALRVMVNNVVGPSGIGVEPQPRKKTGEIHVEYAAQLRAAWKDWERKPEVTHKHHWAKVQRLMVKTWFRDGESFAQQLLGTVPSLDHGTMVPFSLELLEPDLVPIDYDDPSKRIRQGVERNAWGKALGYWVYKEFPSDGRGMLRSQAMKRIDAPRMIHLAMLDRIGQGRGVSEFASVITRLEDIKDYEESERVAAKVAASLTAYVKRGDPQLYDPNVHGNTDDQGNPAPRNIEFSPGMVIDNLGVGEEIGLIDSNRPNPNLVLFRQGQLRAVAGGIGASYSSISRDYNGTYSAQRQELVEQWINYAVLTDDFVGQFVRPTWEAFVIAAHLSGVAPMPRDLDPGSADDALFVGQSMPWIDPLKEAMAWHQLVQDGFASEVEVMRKRGVNPRDVLEQIDAYRKEVKEKGLVFSSDHAHAIVKSAAAGKDAENDDEKIAA